MSEAVEVNILLTSLVCKGETKGHENDSGAGGLTNLLHK